MKTTDDKNELFSVVDKNDKIIGFKTRGECHSNNKIIHRGSGVVIFNKKGEILLQKRSQTKDTYPGYFTTSAAGHVAKGESYSKTAKREMQEEIGVKPRIKFITKFTWHDNRESEIDALFTAIHSGPFKVYKTEVEYVQFVTKDQLKKMRTELTPFATKCFQELKLL